MIYMGILAGFGDVLRNMVETTEETPDDVPAIKRPQRKTLKDAVALGKSFAFASAVELALQVGSAADQAYRRAARQAIDSGAYEELINWLRRYSVIFEIDYDRMLMFTLPTDTADAVLTRSLNGEQSAPRDWHEQCLVMGFDGRAADVSDAKSLLPDLVRGEKSAGDPFSALLVAELGHVVREGVRLDDIKRMFLDPMFFGKIIRNVIEPVSLPNNMADMGIQAYRRILNDILRKRISAYENQKPVGREIEDQLLASWEFFKREYRPDDPDRTFNRFVQALLHDNKYKGHDLMTWLLDNCSGIFFTHFRGYICGLVDGAYNEIVADAERVSEPERNRFIASFVPQIISFEDVEGTKLTRGVLESLGGLQGLCPHIKNVVIDVERLNHVYETHFGQILSANFSVDDFKEVFFNLISEYLRTVFGVSEEARFQILVHPIGLIVEREGERTVIGNPFQNFRTLISGRAGVEATIEGHTTLEYISGGQPTVAKDPGARVLYSIRRQRAAVESLGEEAFLVNSFGTYVDDGVDGLRMENRAEVQRRLDGYFDLIDKYLEGLGVAVGQVQGSSLDPATDQWRNPVAGNRDYIDLLRIADDMRLGRNVGFAASVRTELVTLIHFARRHPSYAAALRNSHDLERLMRARGLNFRNDAREEIAYTEWLLTVEDVGGNNRRRIAIIGEAYDNTPLAEVISNLIPEDLRWVKDTVVVDAEKSMKLIPSTFLDRPCHLVPAREESRSAFVDVKGLQEIVGKVVRKDEDMDKMGDKDRHTIVFDNLEDLQAAADYFNAIFRVPGKAIKIENRYGDRIKLKSFGVKGNAAKSDDYCCVRFVAYDAVAGPIPDDDGFDTDSSENALWEVRLMLVEDRAKEISDADCGHPAYVLKRQKEEAPILDPRSIFPERWHWVPPHPNDAQQIGHWRYDFQGVG
jgi:hypothetical protein